MISPQDILRLVDLTRLQQDDNRANILRFCVEAKACSPTLACVCIYPKFIKDAISTLKDTGIKVATVVNFPEGNEEISSIEQQIQQALADGANEIDLVIPYQDYLQKKGGERTKAVVTAAKQACGNHILKVIIESGALYKSQLIQQVADDVITAGADFIKTSTGKFSRGASLPAVEAILHRITYHQKQGKKIGCKISGGIRSVFQAQAYISLAQTMCGAAFIQPETFRFGTSELLSAIQAERLPTQAVNLTLQREDD